jgi:hypothetical protein
VFVINNKEKRMITLKELETNLTDVQNIDGGRSNEPGVVYWIWPAHDETGRNITIRINTVALSELSGVPCGIASYQARGALLQSRHHIQAAANRKATEWADEISLESEDFLMAA